MEVFMLWTGLQHHVRLQRLPCIAHLDRFAELAEELGATQHILVADVHGKPDHVHQVALNHPHALQAAGSGTFGMSQSRSRA
jgi:hypothetical protein